MQENLWAPWRMTYIKGLPGSDGAPAKASAAADSGAQATAAATPVSSGTPCFLCEAAACSAGTEQARQRLVLVRDERGLIMLNRYPYTSGHLLVAALDHVADLTDLTSSQRGGLMDLTALGEELVRQAFAPQGINIGINLGRCAGAGLPGHLHMHIVPRWNGDTNFMAVAGQVRVIPQALDETFAALDAALQSRNGKAEGGSKG
jgi:ATP adenylyltransferase